MVIIVVGIIYFAPTVNAMLRDHKNSGAIGTLNFFLGWTVLGWVIALVWSMTDYVRPAVRKVKPEVFGSYTHKPKKVIEEKVVPDWKPGQDF